MERLLYWFARAFVALVQALPYMLAVRIGRFCGTLAYWLDARHRRVAINNLTMCFGGEKSPAEIRALARENFRRIGESYLVSVHLASTKFEDLGQIICLVGAETLVRPPSGNVMLALGHFGAFELYAHMWRMIPGYRLATTYRGLHVESLNRLMQSLRERSGCRYFERRFENAELKAFMSQPNKDGLGRMLGLLCDQRAAQGGIRVPFFGRKCLTTAAPAILARRYHCAIYTGICYRMGPGRWRIEVGAEIPTRENGRPRTTEAIMTDINQALEAAVRRDPANWFWVHDRWRLGKGKGKGKMKLKREAGGANAPGVEV